ncbi:MAG: RNA polymerase sigma factor [Lachnospiraceae bacterium]|nr:RNA polymerase sigma factor [Lachnospiraceae bacterium]
MSDSEIVALFCNKDENAVRAAEREYGRYLTTIAEHILGDPEDAREAVNDTYLAAWRSVPEVKPERLSLFLARLVRSISIDKVRKRSSLKRKTSEYTVCLSEIEETLPGGVDPQEVVEYKLLTESIQAFLNTLSVTNRDLFISRYFFFETLKDAASCLEMTEDQAKNRLFQIRRKLKAYLEKEGYQL